MRKSPCSMGWHQLPIQHPLESVPMSHLHQLAIKLDSEVKLPKMRSQDTSWREIIEMNHTYHSSVSQLHMVLHMPAGRILSV